MQFFTERMACVGCVKTVTNTIRLVDRTAKVEADTVARTVRANTSASREDVSRALEAVGYPATANRGVTS